MSQIAKLFVNGRSQAVRLPSAFRFDVKEVFVRKDPETGDVILSRRPDDWREFRELLALTPAPEDFLSVTERHETLAASERDPLSGLLP